MPEESYRCRSGSPGPTAPRNLMLCTRPRVAAATQASNCLQQKELLASPAPRSNRCSKTVDRLDAEHYRTVRRGTIWIVRFWRRTRVDSDPGVPNLLRDRIASAQPARDRQGQVGQVGRVGQVGPGEVGRAGVDGIGSAGQGYRWLRSASGTKTLEGRLTLSDRQPLLGPDSPDLLGLPAPPGPIGCDCS
jgi:hypothetical protein